MASGTFVAYYRVSTAKQGASGLGLAAQQAAVRDYLNGGSWRLAAEFTEIESGKRDDRPELQKAIDACRLYGARLVIAKLDRLSRDIHFLTGLERAGIQFVAADMPEANETLVHMMAVIAQAERKMISKRTKDALAAKKAFYAKLSDEDRAKLQKQGAATHLGGFRGFVPTDEHRRAAVEVRQKRAEARTGQLAPVLAQLQAEGVTSANGLARALTERGIPTARGGSKWTAVQVQRVLARSEPPELNAARPSPKLSQSAKEV